MRLAVAAAVAAAALLAPGPASSALAHSTVAKGTFGNGAPARAYVALTRSDTRAFTGRLRPNDRSRVAAVDFRRFAVVAAVATVPTPCHRFRVTRVERRRRALAVAAVLGEPGEGACIQVVAGAYHVVKLRKAALGEDPPRSAVLRVRRA